MSHLTETERLIVADAIAHVLVNGGLFCWTRWTWIGGST